MTSHFTQHLHKKTTPAFTLLPSQQEYSLTLGVNGVVGAVIPSAVVFTDAGPLELKMGNYIQNNDDQVYFIMQYEADVAGVYVKVCKPAPVVAEEMQADAPHGLARYTQQLFATSTNSFITDFSGFKRVNVIHHSLIDTCLTADYVLTQAVLYANKRKRNQSVVSAVCSVKYEDLQGQPINMLTVLPSIHESGSHTIQFLVEQIKKQVLSQRNKPRYSCEPIILLGGAGFLSSLETTAIRKGTGSAKSKVYYDLDNTNIDTEYTGIDGTVLFVLPALCLVVDYQKNTAVLQCGPLPPLRVESGGETDEAAQPLQL